MHFLPLHVFFLLIALLGLAVGELLSNEGEWYTSYCLHQIINDASR